MNNIPDTSIGKHWWIIEHNPTDKQIHIEPVFGNDTEDSPDWKVIEKFYGTYEEVMERTIKLDRKLKKA